MQKTTFEKFVYWTGASDYLVGFGTWAGAVGVAMAETPIKGQFVPLVTLGTFLLMAAALLVWASRDVWVAFAALGVAVAIGATSPRARQ